MDEKKKLVWANSVFRAWMTRAEEGMPFREILQGQKMSRLWEKTGWLDGYAAVSYTHLGSALPSVFGGSERPRKKEIVVFIILNTLFRYPMPDSSLRVT